jgi:hypothetical protein
VLTCLLNLDSYLIEVFTYVVVFWPLCVGPYTNPCHVPFGLEHTVTFGYGCIITLLVYVNSLRKGNSP